MSNETNLAGIAGKVRRIVAGMSQGIYEKEQLAAMALLCAVAGENIFLLGPPGTAKSMVARRLKCVFSDAKSFEYLMSRFSTPDEIFGPISIARLKDSDCYERLTDGYLPSADIVFLDEIWKSGPSIQNTLLTAINEHVYHNGTRRMELPMKVLIAAGNELPPANEGMEALWDRFLVRMISNCIEDEDNFERMLLGGRADAECIPGDLRITDREYALWKSSAARTAISPANMSAIKWLRRAIINAGKGSREPENDGPDFYVSDRRWKKCFGLMQASAFMNGRTAIDSSDLLLLIHCLWNEPAARAEINRLVADSLWHDISAEIYSINDGLRKLMSPGDNDGDKPAAALIIPETEFVELYNSYYAIENYKDGTALISKWDYRQLSFIDETEGCELVDISLRMPVIRVVKSNSAFELAPSSGNSKPVRTKLMKCAGGIVVDGIPYSLKRKNNRHGNGLKSSSNRNSAEITSLKERLLQCGSQWEALQKNIVAECKGNVFVSETDVCLVRNAMSEVTAQLAETEIRLNNISKIMQ